MVFCGAFVMAWKICTLEPGYAIETDILLNLRANGEVNGQQIRSNIQLDRDFQISSMNAQVAGEEMESQWGDVSAKWEDLSLAGRSFRGFQFAMPMGKVNTTLLSGTLSVQDLRGRSQLTPAWGFRAQWPLQKKLTLSASQLWANDGVSQDSISALSLGYQLNAATKLGLETARSNGGHAWQMSANHKSRNLSVRALWRQADAKFSLAGNPTLNTQRSGYLLNLQAKRVGPFSISASSQKFGDERGGRNNYDHASISFSKPKVPSISLFWQRSDRLRRPFLDELDGLADASTQEKRLRREYEPTISQSKGLQISHSWSKTNINFGFERNSSELRNTPLSKQESNRFSLRLRQKLGKRSSLGFSHTWSTRQTAESNARSLNNSTEITLQHRTKKGIGFSAGLLQQEATIAGQARKTLSSQFGVDFPLGSQTAIGLRYSHRWRASGPYTFDSPDKLQIRISQRLNFGGKATQFKTMEQRRQLGVVSGIVFDDANGNGQREAGEAAVPGITISANAGLTAVTDADGAWRFTDLKPGTYKVMMTVKSVPIEYAILAAPEQNIVVQANKQSAVAFPIVRTGSVSGVVFKDANRNGQYDSGEEPLPGVVIKVDNSETISFSDAKGRFTLVNLPPVKCTIRVATDFLAEEMDATTPPQEIAVRPGQAQGDVQLGLAPMEREVVSTFFKSN